MKKFRKWLSHILIVCLCLSLLALSGCDKLPLDKLPEGIKTFVSQNGTNLSGGQKQRLSVARALTRDAEVYIFDDSFSALDFATDATNAEIEATVLANENSLKYIDGKPIKKVIIVPKKIVNIVI